LAEPRSSNYKLGLAVVSSLELVPPVMNFLSIAPEVTMNPDNADAETLRTLKELHTKLVPQR